MGDRAREVLGRASEIELLAYAAAQLRSPAAALCTKHRNGAKANWRLPQVPSAVFCLRSGIGSA